MIQVTADQIEQYRAQLADYPEALKGLDLLADCEGELEDAAISLALRAGMQPDTSDRWLDGLSKRFRAVVCQARLRELVDQDLKAAVEALAAIAAIPPALALIVILYVQMMGVEPFCKPLEEKL